MFIHWRLMVGLLTILLSSASSFAVNQNANVSETLSTSGTVTALKNCKAASVIETHVGSDSATGSSARSVSGNVAETTSVSASPAVLHAAVGNVAETTSVSLAAAA